MWKDIIGWEKYYEINEHGDVRNKLTKHLVIFHLPCIKGKMITMITTRQSRIDRTGGITCQKKTKMSLKNSQTLIRRFSTDAPISK